jgi:tetratricopeptide (TPR) repeat protein
MMKQDY